MSTTVDQRVVEMRFDNKHFESNVSNTMSTLDKLKQKLHFDGATKGLENVGTAAKKVDMSGLGSGVESVQTKFSAMQVMAVTALANITNSAVNAGKRIVSALTIDPIKTGFQEYETQINAVQTILANTKSKGSTIDDVNVALEELNKYADMTIYNFTEMTRNIGTFTAAGVDLETSVSAIQGIANLAAVSGSTSQQASTAMYQLSQALASGTVKLMDWNSVVNAGMGGEVFQNALKETSKALGTGAEAAIKAEGSFRESLRTGWLTSEVLTETLKKFTSSGANEYVAKYIGQSPDVVESALEQGRAAAKAAEATDEEAYAIEHASKALAEKYGKNADEIKQTLEFAQTATDAATKVKTFTQLWDVLKESAQSGWSQSWKIIIGDFEEAKSLLTPLADFLTGFINKMSDFRNKILESALGRGFADLSEKMKTILSPAMKAADAVKDVVDTVTDLGDIVNKVIRGDFGNGQTRFDALAKAGYNYCEVQNKVNEQLGCSVRYSQEQIDAQNALLGKQEKTTESTENQAEATTSLTDAQKDRLKNLAMMTEEEAKAIGMTDEQIEALNELRKTAEKLGMPLDEFIDKMDEIDGRWLLIEGFKNLGKSIVEIFKAIGSAFTEIFNPGGGTEKASNALFNLIAGFHKLSRGILDTVTKKADALRRTFKGVFAVIDIIVSVTGGALKFAFKLLTGVLDSFGLSIVDVTAWLGDGLVKLRDFIKGSLDFSGVISKIVSPIKKLITPFREWIESLKESENLPLDIAKGIASGLGKAWTTIKDFFKNLPQHIANGFADFKESPLAGFIEKIRSGLGVVGKTIGYLAEMVRDKIKGFLSRAQFSGIASDSIAGLTDGLEDGASTVWQKALEIVKNLVQKVKDFLGIESPSKVFFAIGGFIIAGLIAGLQNGIPDSLGAVKDVFQPMLDWIGGIDIGPILAAVFGIGTAATAYKGVTAFGGMMDGLGEVFEGAGKVLKKSARSIKLVIKNAAKVVKSFSKVLNSIAFSIRVDAIKELAESLGKTLLMLVAAIAILTFLDPKELWNAVGVVAALAVILVGMAFAMNKMSSASATIGKGGINIKGLMTGLAGIGLAILMLGITVKMLGSLSPEEAKQGFLGLAGLVLALVAVVAAFGLLVKGKTAQNIDKFGKTMTKLGIAMLLMAVVAKILGKMDRNELIQGGIAMAAFSVIMVGLMAATRLISGSKNVDTIGKTLLKIALAIGVMGLVAKLLGGMDRSELIQGGLAIIAFSGIMVGLMAATKLINGSKNVDKIGGTLLKIALAIGVMAIVAKLLGNMEPNEIVRGGLAILAFSGVIIALMAATKLISGSKNIGKIGTTLIAVSGAIAIMALTAFMLSILNWEQFAKGTLMISAFAGIIVGLIAATKLVGGNADKITKSIISVAAAIGLLGLIAVLLSLVPVENMKRGLAIVSVLSILMAGLIAVTKLANAKSWVAILALVGAIAAIAGIVALMSKIPTETVIPSAIALGILITVMTGSLALLGLVGKMATSALKGALLLTAMAIPLLSFVAVLAVMQNVQNAMANVLALVALATAMTILMLPLMLVGALFYPAIMGIVALGAIAVPLISFVGVLAVMQTVKNATANVNLLIGMARALTDMLVELAPIAPLALIASTALAAILGLVITIGLIVAALGWLKEDGYFQTAIDTVIPMLVQLAGGLGEMIGAFVAGIATQIAEALPAIATSMSLFMENLQGFIEGAKTVDASVLAGLAIIVAAIIALSVAELFAAISAFLSGGGGLPELGKQLSAFMLAALPFVAIASTISPAMLDGVKALTEAILMITGANLIESLTSWLTGDSSLETFAAQFPILGQGLRGFLDSIGVFSEAEMATVNCAAQAIKTLAEASQTIPNSGGLLGDIVGNNDLGVFADQFPNLGQGLREFVDKIGTFSDAEIATVNCAAQAVKTLAESAKEIPNQGGLLADLIGDNTMETFAKQFPILGTGLKDFLTNIGTFTDAEVATVDCGARAVKLLAEAAKDIPNEGGWAAKIIGDNTLEMFAKQFPLLGSGLVGFLNSFGDVGFGEEQLNTVKFGADAVKTLSTVASEIPNSGGWWGKIAGENDLGTFADQFPQLGTGLRNFINNIGTFTSDEVTTMNSALNAVRALTNLANANLKGAVKHLADFGDDLPGFAKDLSKFCEKMPSSEDTTAAVNNLRTILSAVNSIDATNSGPFATLAKNLKKVGEDAVKKFVKAFTSNSAKTDVKSAAEKLAGKVVEGVETKEGEVQTAGEDLAKKAVSGLETQEDEAKTAGMNLGAGYISGVNAKQTQAYSAGYALGAAGARGINDGQESQSPSKLAAQSGKWLGEGYVIGIGKMGTQVDKAGSNLGETATRSLSSSISRISEMVGADIDSQPTIRPIMDLSDIRSGVSAMSGMLDMNSSIGVRANVGAISTMMTQRSQNGANADIVSAIDKLNKKMDNMGTTSYNINGVTYDDGSNISEAVKTIVRAARIERRV